MNLNQLQDKLIAIARKNPPGDHVPYAFEKRIMTHLKSVARPNAWALWGGPLWRAAVSCVAITVLCGVWALAAQSSQAASQDSLSQSFEAAIFSPPSQQSEDVW